MRVKRTRQKSSPSLRREPLFLKDLEEEQKRRKEGLYFYCSLGPGDKGNFAYIDTECTRLGVPIAYSELPSGARVYRVERGEVNKLPEVITTQWNNIPHGLPTKTIPYSLSYVNSLESLCKEWVELKTKRIHRRR